MENCSCGKPLHYSDPALQKAVEDLIEKLGENVAVRLEGTVYDFMVPRHYIALHGVEGKDLEKLAKKYRWLRVKRVVEKKPGR